MLVDFYWLCISMSCFEISCLCHLLILKRWQGFRPPCSFSVVEGVLFSWIRVLFWKYSLKETMSELKCIIHCFPDSSWPT